MGGHKLLVRQPEPARREGDLARALEFRRAKRHSVRVQALKIALPLAAAVILSLYALPSFLRVSIDKGRGTASVRAIVVEAGARKMLDPRVKGVNDKNDAYEFLADTATQASTDSTLMYLERVRGHIKGHDGKITTLTAPDGVHNSKSDEMTFNNGVVVRREPNLTATFQTATAFMKQQVVISKTPVVVRLDESTIHADSMTMFWSEQRSIFEGNVRTHIERQAAASAAGGQPEAVMPAGDPRVKPGASQ